VRGTDGNATERQAFASRKVSTYPALGFIWVSCMTLTHRRLWSFPCPCLSPFLLVRSPLDLLWTYKPSFTATTTLPASAAAATVSATWSFHGLALPGDNPCLSQPTTNGGLALPGLSPLSNSFTQPQTQNKPSSSLPMPWQDHRPLQPPCHLPLHPSLP